MPLLAVAANFGLTQQGSNTLPSYSAGLFLSVPLWDGGLASAASEVNRARAEELEARLHEQRRAHAFADERSQAVVEQAGQQLAVTSALREQCQKRLAAAEEGYKVSALGIDQVYAAHAALHRAESEVLRVRVVRARAVLQLRTVPLRPLGR